MLVQYEIVCPENNIIEYSIDVIEMEAANCLGQWVLTTT